MDKNDLKGSMFNAKWQHLEQLENDAYSMTILQELMGNEVDYKKDFVVSSIDFSTFVYG